MTQTITGRASAVRKAQVAFLEAERWQQRAAAHKMLAENARTMAGRMFSATITETLLDQAHGHEEKWERFTGRADEHWGVFEDLCSEWQIPYSEVA